MIRYLLNSQISSFLSFLIVYFSWEPSKDAQLILAMVKNLLILTPVFNRDGIQVKTKLKFSDDIGFCVFRTILERFRWKFRLDKIYPSGFRTHYGSDGHGRTDKLSRKKFLPNFHQYLPKIIWNRTETKFHLEIRKFRKKKLSECYLWYETVKQCL